MQSIKNCNLGYIKETVILKSMKLRAQSSFQDSC